MLNRFFKIQNTSLRLIAVVCFVLLIMVPSSCEGDESRENVEKVQSLNWSISDRLRQLQKNLDKAKEAGDNMAEAIKDHLTQLAKQQEEIDKAIALLIADQKENPDCVGCSHDEQIALLNLGLNKIEAQRTKAIELLEEEEEQGKELGGSDDNLTMVEESRKADDKSGPSASKETPTDSTNTSDRQTLVDKVSNTQDEVTQAEIDAMTVPSDANRAKLENAQIRVAAAKDELAAYDLRNKIDNFYSSGKYDPSYWDGYNPDLVSPSSSSSSSSGGDSSSQSSDGGASSADSGGSSSDGGATSGDASASSSPSGSADSGGSEQVVSPSDSSQSGEVAQLAPPVTVSTDDVQDSRDFAPPPKTNNQSHGPPPDTSKEVQAKDPLEAIDADLKAVTDNAAKTVGEQTASDNLVNQALQKQAQQQEQYYRSQEQALASREQQLTEQVAKLAEQQSAGVAGHSESSGKNLDEPLDGNDPNAATGEAQKRLLAAYGNSSGQSSEGGQTGSSRGFASDGGDPLVPLGLKSKQASLLDAARTRAKPKAQPNQRAKTNAVSYRDGSAGRGMISSSGSFDDARAPIRDRALIGYMTNDSRQQLVPGSLPGNRLVAHRASSPQSATSRGFTSSQAGARHVPRHTPVQAGSVYKSSSGSSGLPTFSMSGSTPSVGELMKAYGFDL